MEYPIIANSKDYPETLTWDQYDRVDWDFCKDIKEEWFDGDDRSSTSVAAEFVLQLHMMLNRSTGDDDLEDEGYVIYTQVDPDGQYRTDYSLVNRTGVWEWDDYPVYSRDYSLVNRTGVWAIVRHQDPKTIDVGKIEWKE